MADDPLALVRSQIGLRLAEIQRAAARISPLDLYARMDAIRQLAAEPVSYTHLTLPTKA